MFINNRLGLTEAVETLLNQEQRMNQVANNLANVDTTGYRKESTTFWETLIEKSGQLHRVGKGTRVITDQSQGPLEVTNNPMDVAIKGDGFFQVQTPFGLRYTRAGNFHLNSQGQLASSNGHLVLGEGGAIQIDGKNVSFQADGRVGVDGRSVDKLRIISFPDPSDLQKEGLGLFRLKDGAAGGEISHTAEIQQGYLEGSNVNQVMEMTEMMDLYRNYEAQQKIITTIDALNSEAVSRVGKLS